MSKPVSYYRRLPYTRVAEPRTDSDGSAYFVARLIEIPAMTIDGDTREEALLKLDEIFDDFISAMLEAGDEVPEPKAWPEGYPGVRMGSVSASVSYRPRKANEPGFRTNETLPPWTAYAGV
jgi:predicted RNase H-like HicB family nuclease